MGTNAIIIKKLEDKYKGISVNFDGYLEHTGLMLSNNYDSEEAVEELLELGNLSGIERNIENCAAYGRDYGEKNQFARIKNRIKDFGSAPYIYLWKDETWFVSIRSSEFVEL